MEIGISTGSDTVINTGHPPPLLFHALNEDIDSEATRAVALVDDITMIVLWLRIESRKGVKRERVRCDADTVKSHLAELSECMENRAAAITDTGRDGDAGGGRHSRAGLSTRRSTLRAASVAAAS